MAKCKALTGSAVKGLLNEADDDNETQVSNSSLLPQPKEGRVSVPGCRFGLQTKLPKK